jgi:predicted phosphodiesterase
MKDMKNLRFAMLPAVLMALSFGTGCSSSNVPADTTVHQDIVADTGTDTVADATDTNVPDTTDTASPDVVTPDDSTIADDTEPGDTAVDASDTTDTTPEFVWASGCEGSGTGAAWTMIEDHTFLRGPLIQMSDRNTVTVVWRTAVRSDNEGCVDYEVDSETLTACGMADKNGQYEITLNDLPVETEITYSARVGDVKTGDLTFRTMPNTPKPMKFAVFADAHNNFENLQKMTAVALAEGVDFAFGVGDFVHQAETIQYDELFQGFQDLGSRVNIWSVIGNHDSGSEEYFGSFVVPAGSQDPYDIEHGYAEGWWDRRIGNVWLGGGWVRDFYISGPDSDFGEVGWFRQQFQKNHFKTAQWKLFFIHEPPYCQGWGGCNYDGESCLRPSLVPMAAQNGIQATFHGHMHGYEYGESEGVKIFIPGGLGGELDYFCENSTPPQPWAYNYVHNFAIVETNCDKMIVRFMGLDGVELDRVEVPYVAPTE